MLPNHLRYFNRRLPDETRRDFKRRKDAWRLDVKRHQLEVGYRGDYAECHLCGGQASWCSCCKCYTSTCCVDYGTCMCS